MSSHQAPLSQESSTTSVEEQARASDGVLLAEKLRIAHGTMVDQYGVGNVAAAADMFYDAVFNPDTIIAQRGIPESEQYPDRNQTLAAPLATLRTDRLPNREEFTVAVRGAMTRDIDHRACLYPGAIDVVRAAIEHGPTAIWTHGDMYGQDEREVFGVMQPAWPGSAEQLKKLAGAEVGVLRRTVARAAIDAEGVHGNEAKRPDIRRRIQSVMTVIASEDKFADASIDHLVTYFEGQDVHEVMVYEDRLDNIQRLQRRLGERGISVRGVWVRQGRHAAKDAEFDHTSIQAIDSIAEGANLLTQEASLARGIVFDLDGVLSNQAERVRLQQASVQTLFIEKGWAF